MTLCTEKSIKKDRIHSVKSDVKAPKNIESLVKKRKHIRADKIIEGSINNNIYTIQETYNEG